MPASSSKGQPSATVTQDPPRLPRLEAFCQRHELIVVLVLCALAATRVFLFSAAFPPFDNVDEHHHLDTVCHYANGEVPDGLVEFSEDAIGLISVYGSPEYMAAPGLQIPPPIWSLPPDVRAQLESRIGDEFRNMRNHESTSPPVYYAVAALWYRLGAAIGLSGGRLFYWVRFLNVLLVALLVWYGQAFVAKLYPKATLLRIGVPLMIAFSPQDVFYSVTNDALTPLLFCIAFYLLMRVYRELPGGYGLCAMAGVTAAATMLVKFSNAAILGVVAIVIVASVLRLRKSGRLREGLPKLAVLFAACAVPVGAWLVRNMLVLEDITGSAANADLLTWRRKPLSELFDHPIFTPAGAFIFLRDLATSFWRGEFCWRGARLAMPAADALYWITTLLFVVAAVLSIWKRRKDDGGARFMGWAGLAALAMSAGFLVWISVAYDFGQGFFPSRAFPYFTSGRLMLGPLVPFAVLYISGLDWLMSKLRLRFSRLAVLLAIVGFSLYSEIVISQDAFHSAFNWFHLR